MLSEHLAPAARGTHYKWIALSNTTIGILMATVNSSILLIALPDIFRGIALNPLAPENTSYFLWILMGFMLVTSVLVVSLGRIGDMFGRVRMFNLGFAIFTLFSILLSVTWMTGTAAALWIVLMRLGQGVGGAFLFANSSAILTDAFPQNERGLALGINGVAAIGGSFIGLILGGFLAPIEWHFVFVVSVPIGVFGTVWSLLKLRDNSVRTASRIDWTGNALFAVGLVGILTGIVYGLNPYGGHTMGWTRPFVLLCLVGGATILVLFVLVELKVPDPMFRLSLFRNRAFSMGNISALLAALARGGLQFMLIIWLQGIWLPMHGYTFEQTPLWAGIYLVPLTIGFLVAGPLSGRLADRFGARPFATAGAALSGVASCCSTCCRWTSPIRRSRSWCSWPAWRWVCSSAPNTASVMNSLPADQRGGGAGMLNTFQNSASVLSIGIFFTVITLGLAATLPHALSTGLTGQGVPARELAGQVAQLPPIGLLFASFLGFNPIQQLLPSASAAHVSQAHYDFLTGRGFFPDLISSPFGHGLHLAFLMAAVLCFLAAVFSWLRGPGPARASRRPLLEETEEGLAGSGEVAMMEAGAGAHLE